MKRKQWRRSDAQLLICFFVFAYAKSRSSHDEAHIMVSKWQVVTASGSFLKELGESNLYFMNCKTGLNDLCVAE